MNRFARYTANIALYVVLFFISTRLFTPPALNRQQSEAFIDFSLRVGVKDPWDLFLALVLLAHLLIALVVFFLIKWLIGRVK